MYDIINSPVYYTIDDIKLMNVDILVERELISLRFSMQMSTQVEDVLCGEQMLHY